MKIIEYLPFRIRSGMFVYGLVEKTAEYLAYIASFDLVLRERNNKKNITNKL